VDSGYSGSAQAWAVLATLIAPVVALPVAVLLLGNQPDPRKRSQLRTWAWASGIWLVVAFTGAVLLATL
jgi:hypothetical protein